MDRKNKLTLRGGGQDLVLGSGTAAAQHPAVVYLGKLTSKASQRAMHNALQRLARVLAQGAEAPDALDVPWWSLDYAHATRMRALLAAEVAAGRLAPSTVNQALAAFRGVVREAWRLEIISKEHADRLCDLEPVKSIRLPAGRRLERAEILALLNACQRDPRPAGRRDAALVGLLVGTGLRRSEVVSLRADDLEPSTAGLALKVIGKGDKERRVPIPVPVVSLLRAWLAVRGDVAGCLFTPLTMGGQVMEGCLSDQAVYHLLKRRGHEAGLAHFSPHDTRRTFVSALLDRGVDLATTQRLAGHSKPETTALYDRRGDATAREAVNQLDNLFGGEEP